MSKDKFLFIVGSVTIQSSLGLIETARILSEKVFCGALFGGLDDEIYEEVPAVFISNMMGLEIALQGKEEGEINNFGLTVRPLFTVGDEFQMVRLEHYLAELLKEKLASVKEIKVIEWEYPQ